MIELPTGVVGAAELVAAGQLSPLELVEASLAAIERVEPDVGAFAVVDAAGARRAAAELTDELARTGPRGPLHGIPVAVKDLIDVAGLPTRAGSTVLADAAPAALDAEIVTRLRRCGAVIVGKTHTHEFALGCVTPQTRHPLDPTRIVGGSSGGSAAAVAAGEVLVALGTDTGGSVRVPAAFCGVVGLKPRHGVVPLDGIVPLSPLLDTCGPLTPDVASAALVWDALGFAAPADLTDRPLRVGRPVTNELGAVSAAVAGAFDEAVDRFATAPGVSVVPLAAPDLDAWGEARRVVLQADALEVHRARGWYPARDGDYGPTMRAALDSATRIGTAERVRALRATRVLADRLGDLLASVDVLVWPAAPEVAPLRADLEREAAAGGPGDGRSLLRLCAPVNFLPAAAISVPCPVGTGLPVGAQLVARDEATVLEAARRFEQAQDAAATTRQVNHSQ